MMKLFVILLLTTTVFGDENAEDGDTEVHVYDGPCNKIIDLFLEKDEKCQADVEGGTFVIPDTCSKAMHNEVEKYYEELHKDYQDGEFTKEEIMHHATIEYCVMSNLGHIKNGKFDYESFKSFIKGSSVIEDEKIREKLVSAINDLEQKEGSETGFKEIIETDILNQIYTVCFIDDKHWNPTDH